MSNLYDKKAKMMKERQEQQNLREKYNIEENVVVKETSNMGKFMIKSTGSLIRTISVIILIAFAAVGIITLVYPETREVFIKTVTGAFEGLIK